MYNSIRLGKNDIAEQDKGSKIARMEPEGDLVGVMAPASEKKIKSLVLDRKKNSYKLYRAWPCKVIWKKNSSLVVKFLTPAMKIAESQIQ